MGRDIRVRSLKHLAKRNNEWGVYYDSKGIIELQKPDEDHSIDGVQQTFWHEAMHASLVSLGYEKLSENEKLVEGLAQCIHQIIKTGK